MKRVLLVDDEPNFLRAAVDGLSQYSSLEVLTAGNGREALALLGQRPVDLLVTDLNMPVMDGFELLTRVRELPARPAVIVLTAFGSADARARLKKSGDVALLEKPLDIDELSERVFSALTSEVRGYLPDISLASFLQLLQMERKTCHLVVKSHEHTGEMCINAGQVTFARVGTLLGDAAAFEIIGWGEAHISFDALCRKVEWNVKGDLNFLIMESLRLKDEREAGRAAAAPEEALQSLEETSFAPAIAPAEAVVEVAAPVIAVAASVVAVAAPVVATPTVTAIPPQHSKKEDSMAIEAHLHSLRDIRGYRASAIMNFTGEVLVADSVDPSVDLALVGATFNDIFRSAHEASKKIGLDSTRETTIKTPKGLIVMACSGVEAKVHFHFIAVLGEDGNQALLKMRVDQMMPKVMSELQ